MSLLVPLVGMHFRPPAKWVLEHLPANTELRLVPEPENPYDPKAIKVLVEPRFIPESQHEALREKLLGTGYDLDELLALGSPIWLGFVGDSEGKLCREAGLPGNGDVAGMARDRGCEVADLLASLGFQLDGKPAVHVSVP